MALSFGSIDINRLSPNELATYNLILNDVQMFAETFMVNPVNNEPVQLNYVQQNMLVTTSMFNAIRVHRRAGKSFGLVIYALWYALTHKAAQILVICPDRDKVNALFELTDRFIDASPGFKDCLVRASNSSPTLRKFNNNSTIQGFTTGARTKGAAEALRGQCLPAGELVTLSDGSQRAIEAVTVEDSVVSFDEETCLLTTDDVTSVHSNGVKKVYEIVTESGRVVKATGNHPFFINGNWEATDEILPGDTIAVPKSVPFGSRTMDRNLIKFLAYMIGDGTCSSIKSTPFKFTVNNDAIKEEFLEICKNLDIHVSQVCKDTRRVNLFNVVMPSGYDSEVDQLLKEYGLYGKYCDTKSIPSAILNLDRESSRVFVNRLYSTDGWVSIHKSKGYRQLEVGYCTTSRTLATQLQYTLQKFGIYARVQTRSKELNGVACKEQYCVKIRDQKNIHKFLTEIGLPFGKETASQEVLDYIEQRYADKKSGAVLDTGYRCRKTSGDILYEKVISVTLVGEEETYNLSTAKDHTYIVNGVVTHNTADVVIIDEAAFLDNGDWPAIEPIIFGDAKRAGKVICFISSTPTAERGRYWEMCVKLDGWRQVHVPIVDNPEWTEEMLKPIRSMCNDFTWTQEYLAEFPDVGEGVYKRSYIDRAQRDYEFYNLRDPYYKPEEAIRTMGVDWDKYQAGPNIVVLELDQDMQKFKVVYHEEIDRTDYALTMAVDRIIQLNAQLNPQWIYVDRGYGEAQVELLHKHGDLNPFSGLKTKVVGVSFSESVEQIDPAIGTSVRKKIKPVMVNNTVKWFEDDVIIYPHSFKTFTDQLQDFKVLGVTDQTIKYSTENEHIIDAFCLAAYAMTLYYANPFSFETASRSFLLPPPEVVQASSSGLDPTGKRIAYGVVRDNPNGRKDFGQRKLPLKGGIAPRGLGSASGLRKGF